MLFIFADKNKSNFVPQLWNCCWFIGKYLGFQKNHLYVSTGNFIRILMQIFYKNSMDIVYYNVLMFNWCKWSQIDVSNMFTHCGNIFNTSIGTVAHWCFHVQGRTNFLNIFCTVEWIRILCRPRQCHEIYELFQQKSSAYFYYVLRITIYWLFNLYRSMTGNIKITIQFKLFILIAKNPVLNYLWIIIP